MTHRRERRSALACNARSTERRTGFISVVVLLAMFSIMYLCVVVGRVVVQEIAREHRARLESAADQIVESARDWAALHGAELSAGEQCALAVDDLVPTGVSALAELARPGVGESDFDELILRLSLRTGRLRVNRALSLPVSAPAPRFACVPTP